MRPKLRMKLSHLFNVRVIVSEIFYLRLTKIIRKHLISPNLYRIRRVRIIIAEISNVNSEGLVLSWHEM